MIRTRDFAVFSAALVFLLTALVGTVAHDLWSTGGQVAAVVKFADDISVVGAVAVTKNIDREGNIERLKSKIAAGEGDSRAGAPVFTSVDDVAEDDIVTPIADSAAKSVMIGHTMDGGALFSDGLWRFIGFGPYEQIGTALGGTPIFGVRVDSPQLDDCGGIDDGSGYKLYLQTDREMDSTCFTQNR